jgi:hypothetical protein
MTFKPSSLCLLTSRGSFASLRQQTVRCRSGCQMCPWSALRALCAIASLEGFAALAISVSHKALQLSSAHPLSCCVSKHQWLRCWNALHNRERPVERVPYPDRLACCAWNRGTIHSLLFSWIVCRTHYSLHCHCEDTAENLLLVSLCIHSREAQFQVARSISSAHLLFTASLATISHLLPLEPVRKTRSANLWDPKSEQQDRIEVGMPNASWYLLSIFGQYDHADQLWGICEVSSACFARPILWTLNGACQT